MIRYLAAASIAALIIAGCFGFSRHIHRSFVERVRQSMRAAKADGTLPKELEGVDIEAENLEGLEVRVSESEERWLTLAWAIEGRWFLWVPVVIAAAFGIAHLMGRPAHQP